MEEDDDATGTRGAEVKLREGRISGLGGDDHRREVEHEGSSPR